MEKAPTWQYVVTLEMCCFRRIYILPFLKEVCFFVFFSLFYFYRYLVTNLMGADLNNIVKCQKLTDDHIQFLIYQLLRGLKVLSGCRSFRVSS